MRLCHYFVYSCAVLIVSTSSLSCALTSSHKNNPLLYDIRVKFLQEQYQDVIRMGNDISMKRVNKKEFHRVFYYIALSHLKEHHVRAARRYFDVLIKEGKRVSFLDEVYLKHAESFALEGMYEKAYAHYSAFVKKYPDNSFLPTVFYQMGIALQKMGRFSEARSYLEKIHRLYPNSFEARLLDNTDMLSINSFTVQVGSFHDYENAQHMVNDLQKNDYESTVLVTRKDSAPLYRVRVGSFSARKDAEDFEQKLQDEGFDTLIYP